MTTENKKKLIFMLDMLYVPGENIQTRVHVTLKLSLIYCYLISIISCTDRN